MYIIFLHCPQMTMNGAVNTCIFIFVSFDIFGTQAVSPRCKGSCINVWTHACKGAQIQTGLCTGPDNVKCCPTPGTETAKSTVAPKPTPPPTPAPSSCAMGGGVCIDTAIKSQLNHT